MNIGTAGVWMLLRGSIGDESMEHNELAYNKKLSVYWQTASLQLLIAYCDLIRT